MNVMEELRAFVLSEIAMDLGLTPETLSADEDLVATGL